MRATISNLDDSQRHAWTVCSARHGGLWMRLHAHEEERLEEATSSLSDDAAQQPILPISGGRAEARLGIAPWAGTVLQRYLELPPMPLARSIWCFKTRNGKWTPFAPHDDEVLEAHLQDMLLRAEAEKEVVGAAAAEEPTDLRVGAMGEPVLEAPVGSPMETTSCEMTTADNEYHIRLTRSSTGVVQCEMRPLRVDSWLGRTHCSVSRGWAGEALPKMSEEELRVEKNRPAALVLVVHGVGEALWRKENTLRFKDIEQSVENMRALAAKSLTSAAAQGAQGSSGDLEGVGEGAGGELTRVEFLAVDWSGR